MTPARLHQIEELYHAARVDPEVLVNAEAELRLEVESLLAHEGTSLPPLFIDAASAEDLHHESPDTPVVPGSHIGPYVIEGRLGAGGMGVVFRALDTRLNRPVAVKLISDKLADPTAGRRFQREAQLASSLNHPHILTVHDAGEHEGRQYLVTEFVDGGTLNDWAKAEKRTWRQIIELLSGVADGLAAAHGAGILHRDIKPANILVARNGYGKLGDFGLAKPAEVRVSDAVTTPSDCGTRPGNVIGTIEYLSPEQARGVASDARSDIFSFGVVLYETLTGRRPFRGETDLDLLTAIVDAEPEALGGDLPSSLRAIVEKTLEKDPSERYQTARDLVVDLRHAARRKTESRPIEPVHAARRKPRWPWIVVASALVSVAAVIWIGKQSGGPVENPLANATFTRLTDYEGAELDASISPDGKFVAFLSDRDGPFHPWLIQVGAGNAIDLTPGSEDQRAPLRSVGFSHDGSEIWLAGTESRKVRMLPLLGGAPRVFLGSKVVAPVWSPDGSRLAYHTLDSGDPIYVADRDGANARRIFGDSPDRHNHYLAWGADGEWIYFVHGTPASDEMDLWRIRASGGNPERLTQKSAGMRDPTPLGRRTMLYVAYDSDGSGPWIWAFDLARRSSRRITFGLEKYTSLSVSADGRRLAATVANPRVGLWTVPILNSSVAGERDAKRFALPSSRALAPRFRGTALYYLSSQGTGDGLWRFEDGKTTGVWHSAQGGLLQAPAVSPDGRHVVIVVREMGKSRLRVITADGAESNALAAELNVEGSPDWSPDGNWIVTGGKDSKGEGLFKIPAAGGAPIRLTGDVGRDPVWSPDGSIIAYSGPNVFTLTPLMAVRPDGSSVKLPQIRTRRDGERLRFLPNGKGLVYMQGDGSTPWQDFWLLDLTTMKTRRLTRLNDRAAMRTFDITPDGKQIVFDRLRENSAVVLIDLRTGR
ncbi:MAG TPA: LpqB family beta-propeller domain-containing protein [Bryobacteraceae bacterium]|jgi:serine/threonine protein kinase|nr:LpqB family beta-propeller domain-containing protein [Bryobacteraceae bacterium]